LDRSPNREVAMRQARWAAIFAALVMLLVFLPACEEEKDEEATLDEWMERGKEYLVEGDGARAYLAFLEVLKIESGNLEGHYGVLLSDVLQFSDTAAFLMAMLTGQPMLPPAPEEVGMVCQKLDACGYFERAGATYNECISENALGLDEAARACVIASPDCDTLYERCVGAMLPPSDQECSDACVRFASCGYYVSTEWTAANCQAHCRELFVASELQCFLARNDCEQGPAECFVYYGETISALVEEFWTPIGEEMAASIAAVEGHPDFLFELDFYTVPLIESLFQPVFSGFHDESDLSFFAGVYAAMDALLSAAISLNLDLNPVLLAGFGLDELLMMAQADEPAPVIDLLIEIDRWLDLILNDPIYQDALTLREEGAESFRHAGEQIGRIFGEWATMIEMIAAEHDEQTDDVIRYVDQNGDGNWNEPEPLLVPGVIELDYALAWVLHDLFLALKVDFTDGYPFHLEELNPLLELFGLYPVILLIDVLDVLGVDSVELGAYFREVGPEGLRPLLADAQDLIRLLVEALSGSAG
jgi:hypothetical protein